MFALKTSHIKKYLDTKVLDVDFNNFFTIKTSNGTIESKKKVVVSSGGLSYSSLGASSFAFDIAKNLTTQSTN